MAESSLAPEEIRRAQSITARAYMAELARDPVYSLTTVYRLGDYMLCTLISLPPDQRTVRTLQAAMRQGLQAAGAGPDVAEELDKLSGTEAGLDVCRRIFPLAYRPEGDHVPGIPPPGKQRNFDPVAFVRGIIAQEPEG